MKIMLLPSQCERVLEDEGHGVSFDPIMHLRGKIDHFSKFNLLTNELIPEFFGLVFFLTGYSCLERHLLASSREHRDIL